MYGKALKYLVLWTGAGFALMAIVKPSPQEVNKIREYSSKTQGYSDVLRAAADPNSKPIYLQKPGEQFLPRNNNQSSSPVK